MTEPGPTREQIADVIESVQTLAGQVRGLRDETARQSGALERSRTALVVVAIALVIALAVGVLGAVAGMKANRVLDQNEKDRRERSVASCQQQNDFYEKHNALVTNDQETFRIIIRETISDAARTFAQERLDSFEANRIALRDCTPAGIARYLSTTTTTR